MNALLSRPALYQRSLTANADMVCPKLPKGKSITMAARLKSSKKEAAGSGVMYNVHVRLYKIFKYMYISLKNQIFLIKF